MHCKNVSENSGKIQDTTKFLCLYKQLLSRDLNWIGGLSFFFFTKVCLLDAEKDGEKSNDMWLDLSDEDSCNWMMFVRPAQNHLEQNLVAYQYGSEIFYTTIKNIQPKQELKVSVVQSRMHSFEFDLTALRGRKPELIGECAKHEGYLKKPLESVFLMRFSIAGLVCSIICRVCKSKNS